MKAKIAIDLPTREKLLAGLTPRELHPPLGRAEEVAAKAEQALESARRELADRERIVADLPARIQRGEVKARTITEALRDRDAAALLVVPAEAALATARDRVAAEEKNAQLAVERELDRRAEQLERAVAEVSPVLDEINALADALAAARGSGAHLTLDWPSSPMALAERRMAMHSSGPAPVSLMWSTKP